LGVRLDLIAAGAGIPVVFTINTQAEIADGRKLLESGVGLSFILLRVKEGPALKVKRSLVPHVIRDRFRAALLAA
jgi:hypothetical protein